MDGEYGDMMIKSFLDAVASKHSIVPAGGTGAALVGALAAALLELLARATLGKRSYGDAEEEMEEILRRGSRYRQIFLEDMEGDVETYRGLMAAFRLPRETDGQKEYRRRMIDDKVEEAVCFSLRMAEDILVLISLISEAVAKGNRNAVADGKAAAMLARSAGLVALLNAEVNMSFLKDEERTRPLLSRLEKLKGQILSLEKEILQQKGAGTNF
ncbi:MAG: cyclodeaminase/cyclohydrolase family protein [Clostridia bacterium]|jgi:formiminotetrahydrofolate cyclodeaminase